MNSGIYKIYNKISDKTYIGSSEHLGRRIKDHKVYLRKNTHPSTHLQNSFNKHGIEAFEYSIIENCEIEILEEREDYWVSTIPIEKRYNQRAITKSNRGMKWSNEAKEKLKGRVSWNRGLKGVCKATAGSIKKGQRISIETEFKKGMDTWNKGTIGICKPNITSYKPICFEVVSPSNILYSGINLFRFSQEMKVNYCGLQQVIFYHKKDNYKGWRLPQKNEVFDKYGFWNN